MDLHNQVKVCLGLQQSHVQRIIISHLTITNKSEEIETLVYGFSSSLNQTILFELKLNDIYINYIYWTIWFPKDN